MKLPTVSRKRGLVVAIAAAVVIAIVFIVMNQTDDGGGRSATAETKDECDRWNDGAVATVTNAISIRRSDTASEEERNTLVDELQTMNTSRPKGCGSSERLLELHEEYKAELGF